MTASATPENYTTLTDATGYSQLRGDLKAFRGFVRERRLQRGDVVGQSLASRFHETKGIIFSAIRGTLKYT
jgi:hypothetical protein